MKQTYLLTGISNIKNPTVFVKCNILDIFLVFLQNKVKMKAKSELQ